MPHKHVRVQTCHINSPFGTIQLRLAQRMKAIGQLAGGIAHDFKNLLAVIMGSADILFDALPREHSLKKKVELIRESGSSAADLIRQLLAFSHQQVVQPLVLDVKKIVERTRAMLQRTIGEDIDLRVMKIVFTSGYADDALPGRASSIPQSHSFRSLIDPRPSPGDSSSAGRQSGGSKHFSQE